MRRLLVRLGVCLGLAGGLVVPGGVAHASGTYVIRGGSTNGNPLLTSGVNCTLNTSTIPAETTSSGDRNTPPVPAWGAQPTSGAPTTVAAEHGSRYLSYPGSSSYARGPWVLDTWKDLPTSITARVASLSGTQKVEAMVALFAPSSPAPAAGSWVTLIGWKTAANIGPGWTSYGISNTENINWIGYKTATSTAAAGWAAISAQSLKTIESGRSTWAGRAGIFGGCVNGASMALDWLQMTSVTSGTRTWDFEGLASSVTAAASTRSVVYGNPITLTGKLVANTGSPSLRVVRCQGATCQYIGGAQAAPSGATIAFQVFPDPGWTYGVRFDGDANYNPAESDVGTIAVRPYLTAALSQKKAHLRSRVHVGGIVGPCTGAARHLVIQRRVGKKWKRVGRAMAPACAINGSDQYAKLRGLIRARSLGRWKLRVVVPASQGYAESDSHLLRLRVTRAPVKPVTVVHYAPPPVTHTTTSSEVSSPAPAPPPPV